MGAIVNDILGGSGALGGLGAILDGGTGGGVAALLPAVIGMLGGSGGSGASSKSTKSTKSGKSGKVGGSAATNGLSELISVLGSKGLGDIVNSWVGGGPNKPITPTQVKKALGPKKVKALAAESGVPEGDVATNLAAILPGLVNHLTPDGKLPDTQSLMQSLNGLQGRLAK